MLLVFGERRTKRTTQQTSSPQWKRWWVYYAVGMLQCAWNWEPHQSGKHYEERRICEVFKQASHSQQLNLVFQHYSDPKHTLLVNHWLQKTNVNFTDWAAQSYCLDPTVNLWGELKTKVHARGHQMLRDWAKKNVLGLFRRCMRDWLQLVLQQKNWYFLVFVK